MAFKTLPKNLYCLVGGWYCQSCGASPRQSAHSSKSIPPVIHSWKHTLSINIPGMEWIPKTAYFSKIIMKIFKIKTQMRGRKCENLQQISNFDIYQKFRAQFDKKQSYLQKMQKAYTGI